MKVSVSAAVCKIWDMKLEADSLAASTWELDKNGNKIPGSEERVDLENYGPGASDVNNQLIGKIVWKEIVDRTKRTPQNKWVVGEIWQVDTKRPAMELYGKVMKRQGIQPVPDGDERVPA